MTYIIAGFVFGLLIPYITRRFSKFMPATPAYAIYRIIIPNKTAKKASSSPVYNKLRKKYFMRSFGYGIICAALSALVFYKFETDIGWYLGFVWVLLLLTEIDFKMFLLPDILTVPLLITGFVFSSMVSGDLTASASAAGALTGYVLPVIASLLMLWKSIDAFGGGDIKLLAAIGAWLGVDGVIYTILLSCLVFGIYSLLRKQKAGAFGPALAFSAIIMLLYTF